MLIFMARGLAAAFLACAMLAASPLVTTETQAASDVTPILVTARGTWSATVTYALDDLVTLRGSAWRSKHAANRGKRPGSTSPSTAADWELFASGFNPLGAWKNTITYQRNDLVTRSGSTWRGLRTNLNKVPGTSVADWQLFAQKGATGATGATGPQGPQGPAGPNVVGNGTQAAPIINFTSSPDTGIFSPGGGKLALAENGALFLHDIGIDNAAIGLGSLANTTGTGNSAVGNQSLASNTTGLSNSATGNRSLFSNTEGSYNSAFGAGGLQTNTTGSTNTAVGFNALLSNTTANDNSAVGVNALLLNTTGANNTAMGSGALTNNTTAGNNTAMGFSALNANTTGIANAAFGYQALMSNTTGLGNTAVGPGALAANTISSANTAVGGGALGANTTGSTNTALGNGALGNNSTGSDNVAVGFQALQLNTESNNTAVGSQALASNTVGELNSALGREALRSNTTGTDNTAVGNGALFSNDVGYGNTAIGFHALDGNTNGGNNIAIGVAAGSLALTDDSPPPIVPVNNIFIGNTGAARDFNAIKIGTEGTQQWAFIAGIRGITTGANDAVAVLIDSNGQLGTVSSSRRYKEDIHSMGAMSAMLARLRPVSFRYRKPFADGSKPIQYGLIAEEVAEAFPYLAVYNAEGQPETVKYHELPAFLLEGFQEQQKIIAAQAERIAVLEERGRIVDAQQAQIVALEERLQSIEAQLIPPSMTAASAAP